MNDGETIGNNVREYEDMRVHFNCRLPIAFAINVSFPKYVSINLAKGKMYYAGLSEFLGNFPK